MPALSPLPLFPGMPNTQGLIPSYHLLCSSEQLDSTPEADREGSFWVGQPLSRGAPGVTRDLTKAWAFSLNGLGPAETGRVWL